MEKDRVSARRPHGWGREGRDGHSCHSARGGRAGGSAAGRGVGGAPAVASRTGRGYVDRATQRRGCWSGTCCRFTTAFPCCGRKHGTAGGTYVRCACFKAKGTQGREGRKVSACEEFGAYEAVRFVGCRIFGRGALRWHSPPALIS